MEAMLDTSIRKNTNAHVTLIKRNLPTKQMRLKTNQTSFHAAIVSYITSRNQIREDM
jgi:hypothetical protein